MNSSNVIFFLISFALVSCKEFVPVILWSSQGTGHPFSEVSAFAKIGPNDLTDYLLKKVKVQKPSILVFLEENLSVEDFSRRDTNGDGAFPSLKNISKSAGDSAYLSSVHEPKKGLLNLKSFGYLWKSYQDKNSFQSPYGDDGVIYEVQLKEPPHLEGRPNLLRSHDEYIAKVYNEAISKIGNVLAVYSGNHNSWFGNKIKRFRRDASDEVSDSSDLLIMDEKGDVRMSTTPPIIFRMHENGKESVINLTKVMGTPTTDVEKNKLSMTVRFSHNNSGISIKFEFSGAENEWWTLESAEILGFRQDDLIPDVPIGAPSGHSFFCNPTVVFAHGSASLKFENFQVQPRVGKGKGFGPPIHCVPFFSIAIWSGLVTVLILGVVLAWGIVMIMDINTNDRFDDPKGKTITISAAD